MNENTLQCILCSGSYHFFCDGYRVEVKLQFDPSYENQRGKLSDCTLMHMKQVMFLLK